MVEEENLSSKEGDTDQTHPRMQTKEISHDPIVPLKLCPNPKNPRSQSHSLKAQMHRFLGVPGTRQPSMHQNR
jgi:hypothetical protein